MAEAGVRELALRLTGRRHRSFLERRCAPSWWRLLGELIDRGSGIELWPCASAWRWCTQVVMIEVNAIPRPTASGSCSTSARAPHGRSCSCPTISRAFVATSEARLGRLISACSVSMCCSALVRQVALGAGLVIFSSAGRARDVLFAREQILDVPSRVSRPLDGPSAGGRNRETGTVGAPVAGLSMNVSTTAASAAAQAHRRELREQPAPTPASRARAHLPFLELERGCPTVARPLHRFRPAAAGDPLRLALDRLRPCTLGPGSSRRNGRRHRVPCAPSHLGSTISPPSAGRD